PLPSVPETRGRCALRPGRERDRSRRSSSARPRRYGRGVAVETSEPLNFALLGRGLDFDAPTAKGLRNISWLGASRAGLCGGVERAGIEPATSSLQSWRSPS